MKKSFWSSTRILAAGFVAIILIGALLLSLPAASRDGQGLPILGALFTATSATCVTGLVLYDTWTQFSGFGQAVILILIQIGGLGFMTAIIAAMTLTRRQIGLKQRTVLGESVGITQLSGVVRLSRRILLGTALFEGVGALLLATSFIPVMGPKNGIWCAVFHAVSGFCNAGFDILGQLSPGSSLVYFKNDPVVVLTLAFLILIGGIGFIVWSDIVDAVKEKRRLGFHARVALCGTAILTAAGTVAFLILEADGSLDGMSVGTKLVNAFFLAVTPRTAGFNTVPMLSLTSGGELLTIMLMFIGAAPGGTGGGVKLTTFVVVVYAVAASLKGEKDTSVWRFRLDDALVRRALCTSTLYICVAALGALILCSQGVDFTASLFESFSAIGTVGLTLGVTPSLNAISQLTMMLMMYAGRLGSFTVFLAVAGAKTSRLSYPIGKIIVG